MRQSVITSTIVTTVFIIAGCGAIQTQVNDLEATAKRHYFEEQEKAAQPIPVVTTTSAAWLMGQQVSVLPTPSPMLTQEVTYCPSSRVTLPELAAWVSQKTALAVDTAEVQSLASSQTTNITTTGTASHSPLPGNIGAQTPQSAGTQLFTLCYSGTLSGLLDVAASTAGVWSKFSEGRIVFYRTETKTFYLPAIPRTWKGSSSIATSSGQNGSSGDNAASSSGGATSTSAYEIDVWGALEKTAKTVGGSAQVIANASVGSLTVTGTPVQVRNVEEWVKNLSDNLSQQVSITLQVVKVKVKNGDNYNWNPNVVFNSLSGNVGLNLSGPQAPVITAGVSPLNLSANILKSATGTAAQYSGSQLALQALSTLGKVTETLQQTVVTLNGQPAPIQIANQLTYLAATTQSASAIGTVPVPPSLTPGQITTGFSAMFLPRIVNGKILMAMTMSNSTLVDLGKAGTEANFIQTPNVDISTFPNSFMLTPGDTLLLTGLQLDNGKSNQRGVGSATNYVLGGGVEQNIEKQLIAIVITAKVL